MQESLKFGSDLIQIQQNQIEILSRRENTDWEVRDYNRLAIYFRDRRYYLKRVTPENRGRIRFLLVPWSEDLQDNPWRIMTYDEAYVRERDSQVITEEFTTFRSILLVAAYPLLGFLPSGLKQRIQEWTPFDARMATRWSLWIEYFAFVISIIPLYVVFYATGNPLDLLDRPWMWITLLLLSDSMMRLDQVMRDTEFPDGLLEWHVKRVWRLFRR